MIYINLSHYQGKLATMQHVSLYFTYYKDIMQNSSCHENIEKNSLYLI